MTLINIEYGSLASSDTLNKNFSYLEDTISELSESTTTLISSIMSNIATINSRLSELADDIKECDQSCQSALVEQKSNTRTLLNKVSTVPNWALCYSLVGEEKSSYTSSLNGYLFTNPATGTEGTLTVNGVEAPFSTLLPIKAGDKIVCSATLESAFFIPAITIAAEETQD